MRQCLRLALALALVGLAAAPAQATLLTWTFQGRVTDSPAFNPLSDELPVGTPVAFTVDFDTGALDRCGVPGAGFYAGPSASALVNGITYTSDWTAMEVNNAAGNCIGGDGSGIAMRFVGFDGPFYSASVRWAVGPGDAQPTVAPFTALFQFGYACALCGDVTGAITTADVTPLTTPEPASFTLALAGLTMLGARRRFRRRTGRRSV